MQPLARPGRRRAALILALLGSGVLGGCTTPQFAQPEPQMAVPEGWQEAGVSPVTLDLATYWRQLDDPLLTEFVEAAVAHNLDLAQSAARLEQAQAQLNGARAGWSPQLSVNGRASQEFIPDFPDDDSYNLGADASWEIDLFGRIGSEVAASEADFAAAGYSLADLQRLITGQVALATISARATALQLAIARDTLAFQDENLQIARWRVQAGLVSSLDVEQARTQRAATAASIPQLESNLTATANAISTLIGEPPGRVLRLLLDSVEDVPAPPALAGFEAPGEVLRRRPDVRAAEASLLASTARIKGAEAQLLPSIQLGGVIGIPTSGLGSLFEIVTGTLFGSVSQLVFDGGRTRARIDNAEAVAEGSLAAWQLSILGALEEVETAAVDLEKSGERVAIYDEALEAASNSALLARSQYQAGLTDFRNLLTSEAALLGARNAVVAAQAERASAFVRLTQALGGGWAPTDYPLPVSDRIDS
jgi:NodT family efflux transporter outer membrane factor (OMF) lipoprotein